MTTVIIKPLYLIMNIVDDMREKLTLNEHGISNVHSTDYPGAYYKYNDAWDFEKFKTKFRIDNLYMEKNEMQFDMVGIDASIANAFRRILLAEVPTMAIDKVFMKYNTSVIPDEVLAHRIGLIPLKVDARLFEFAQNTESKILNPTEILKFELSVTCEKNPLAPKDVSDPSILYKHAKVYSSDIKWKPLEEQKDLFTEIRPLYDDILLVKMRPGQKIDMELHAMKGVGKTHAKFSPVATASYRLLPEITLLKPVTGKTAKELQACFSPGVIEVVKNKEGKKEARVVDARKDSCSREVLRHPHLKDLVKLSKVRDHFIFSVESVAGVGPEVLVEESIKILMAKCRLFIKALDHNQQELMESD